jgi:propionate CoA-transferase
MAKPKFVTAAEAVSHIKNEDTVAISGFIGVGHAEEITCALEKRYQETQTPRGLTVVWASSQSNTKDRIGCDRFSYPGFVKRALVGHIGMQYNLSAMASNNEFEAYNIPLGVLVHILRARAGNKPCITTPVGLGTFADPREGGCKLNQRAIDCGPDYVSVVEIDGKEYLQYKTFDVDVAVIRGTTADTHGNITMEHEAILLEALEYAAAAHASGGIVIAQVERICEVGSLNPQAVRVPGILVDYVVKTSDVEKYHKQTMNIPYEGALSGETRIPMDAIKIMDMSVRKVMARRAAMELIPGAVVDLGMGVPDGVSSVAVEEGLKDEMSMLVECGVIGGSPCSGLDFGCSFNPESMVTQPTQFDLVDGGILDLAVLSMAELDQYGNVNVSKFGPRIYGAGGFINIAQNCKTLVFVGTMTTGGLKAEISDGCLKIVQEGKSKKIVPRVGHKTFSGEQARKTGQKVLYVTERAVFEMRANGLTLIEIAPGVDLKRDVLDQIDFAVKVAENLRPMDERIFREGPMGIYDEIMAKGA